MASSFAQLLAILTDTAQDLPVARLAELSDLEPDALGQFREAWPSMEPSRRKSLLAELGQLADLHFEYNFEHINRFAMGDEDPAVRTAAIQNLWECEDLALVPDLLRALMKDPDSAVRASSANALSAFVFMCEVSDAHSHILRQIEDALFHATEKDPHPDVRLRALETLGYSSRSEVTSLIQKTFDSGDEEQRMAALLAMGRSASEHWAPQVLSEIHSPAPQLRARAARAAGEIELRESLPELIHLLGDVNSDVRLASIWSLGQIGTERSIEALADLLESTEDPAESADIDEAIEHALFVDSTRDLVRDVDEEEEDPA